MEYFSKSLLNPHELSRVPSAPILWLALMAALNQPLRYKVYDTKNWYQTILGCHKDLGIIEIGKEGLSFVLLEVMSISIIIFALTKKTCCESVSW